MAMSIEETIKRLSWQFTSDGADKVASDINKTADATAKLTTTSQTTEKSTLDLEKSFNSLERRFSTTIRAQQDYAAVQAKVNEAVKQHPELQERANQTLEAAKAHFEKATGGATGFSKVMDSARESMIGFALEGGPVGAILGSFGPWGIAAAAGIALVREGFNAAQESAKQFGERALEVRAFATAAGVTTDQVRGLAEAGEKVGISGEKMKVSFERLTVNLAEARGKTGELYEGIQALDPALADDIAAARNGADAWDLLGKALDKTTDATLKAKIARAAGGRGGVELIPAFAETNNAGGIDKYAKEVQKATGVTDSLTQATAKQVAEIEALKKQAVDTFESIYSQAVLDRMKQAAEFQLQIAQSAKAVAAAAGTSFGASFAPRTDEFGMPFPTNSNAPAPRPTPVAPSPTGEEKGDGGHGAMAAAIKEETAATQALNAARIESMEAERGAAGEAAKVVALQGASATGAEIAAASFHKLTQEYLANRFGLVGTAEALERYQRALHGDTGTAIAALQDQRNVITAIGGAAKQTAQYAADYNAALRAAKDPADALAIATEKYLNAQAAANSAAQTQLKALQDQGLAAGAVTGQEQIQAQWATTLNSLLRDNVNSETAFAVAAQQATNAETAATTAVLKQVEALKDADKMIKARQNGTEATTAAQIAYKNAVESAASPEAAALLKSQMLKNSADGVAAATRTAANNTADLATYAGTASDAFEAARRAAQGIFEGMGGDFGNFDVPHGTQYTSNGGASFGTINGSTVSISDYNSYYSASGSAQRASQNAGYLLAGGNIQGAYDAALTAGGVGTGASFNPMNSTDPYSGANFGAPNPAAGVQVLDQITAALNAQTTDKATQDANNQREIQELLKLPGSIEQQKRIGELTNAINGLTTSTNTLNATNQDLLSPYYTQDPRTSHIGFRSQGMADGGYVDVPGSPSANDNMVATIPVASGERIYVDSMPGKRGGSGGTVVNMSMNVTIAGNANKDQVMRTMFQSGQTMAKQLAQVSK